MTAGRVTYLQAEDVRILLALISQRPEGLIDLSRRAGQPSHAVRNRLVKLARLQLITDSQEVTERGRGFVKAVNNLYQEPGWCYRVTE